MIQVSSAASRTAYSQGKLQGLGAVVRDGIVWISDRIRGEKMAELLGTSELPILMSTEALSRLILSKAHCQDHRRNLRDIAARSRCLVWIVGAVR